MYLIANAVEFLAAAKSVIANGGPRSLYAGIVPYMLADGLSGAVKFVVFEKTDRRMKRLCANSSRKYALSKIVSAGFAMLVCSVILVPGEVLKMHLQQGTVGSRYRGLQVQNKCALHM